VCAGCGFGAPHLFDDLYCKMCITVEIDSRAWTTGCSSAEAATVPCTCMRCVTVRFQRE
jgi:hypothetical protein